MLPFLELHIARIFIYPLPKYLSLLYCHLSGSRYCTFFPQNCYNILIWGSIKSFVESHSQVFFNFLDHTIILTPLHYSKEMAMMFQSLCTKHNKTYTNQELTIYNHVIKPFSLLPSLPSHISSAQQLDGPSRKTEVTSLQTPSQNSATPPVPVQ